MENSPVSTVGDPLPKCLQLSDSFGYIFSPFKGRQGSLGAREDALLDISFSMLSLSNQWAGPPVTREQAQLGMSTCKVFDKEKVRLRHEGGQSSWPR